jgi:hypothetical protein
VGYVLGVRRGDAESVGWCLLQTARGVGELARGQLQDEPVKGAPQAGGGARRPELRGPTAA